jgi:hypothetical protein
MPAKTSSPRTPPAKEGPVHFNHHLPNRLGSRRPLNRIGRLMSWDVVQGLLPALNPSSWLIAPGRRGSDFHAPRAILYWFDMQVLTSRTQITHEQQCFLARLQISLTPKPLSGWVLIALFSAHFHEIQALKALVCSHSSDCPRGLLHAFAPSDADGFDGATRLTPCYHPHPSPDSNPS